MGAGRVSFVAPRLSPSPRSGGELRSLRLAQALGRAADLTVVIVGPAVDVALLRAETGAREVLSFPGASGVAGRLLGLRRRWPLAVARAWSEDAAAWVTNAARAGAITVVDFLDPLALVGPAVPVWLSLHNVEHDLATLPPGPGWRGIEQRLERRRMRQWERQAVARPGLRIVVPSRREATLLDPADVMVLPNGTDVPASRPPIPDDGLLLFVGALDYPPNQEGLRWWTQHVWPRLQSPDVPRLTVVGRAAAALPSALARHESLDVVGAVDDVAPYVDRATVSVVPLLTGGGTRIKLIEALAHGRPTVTTTKGAEGVGVTHDVDVLVADDAQLFAAHVSSLWSDRDARERLGSNGFSLARTLDWRHLSDEFAAHVVSR